MKKTLFRISATAVVILGALLFFKPQVAYAASNCQSAGSGTWSTVATWTNCNSQVPVASDSVEIMSGHTVTLDVNAAVANVTIDSGGTLTVSGSHSLTVSDTFINNGTLTAGAGVVKIPGTIGNSTAATAFNNLSITSGLVGYWKFDEGSGTTAIDSSGYGNNGTLTTSGSGIPTYDTNVPSKINFSNPRSLNFVATNGSYVSVPTPHDLFSLNKISLSVWIKVPNFPTCSSPFTPGVSDFCWSAIVTQGDNTWHLQRSFNNNFLEFTNYWDPVGPGCRFYPQGTKAVDDNLWHHVVAVYDGATKYLYWDGAVDASCAVSGSISITSDQVYIGSNSGATDRYWNGNIDDVRIYNRALSATEVAQLYAGLEFSVNTVTLANSVSTVNGNLNVAASAILETGTNTLSLGGASTYTNNGQIRHTPTAPIVCPNSEVDGTNQNTVTLANCSGMANATILSAAGGGFPNTGSSAYDTCPASSDLVRRYWKITPNTAGTANVTFRYRDSEVPTPLVGQQLKVYKCVSGAWTAQTAALTPSAVDASGYRTVTATGLGIGSSFALAGTSNPTAVILTSFQTHTEGLDLRGLGWGLALACILVVTLGARSKLRKQ